MSSTATYRTFVNPFASSISLEERLFFLLRFAILGCFIGHGIWGLLGKTAWLSFFEVFFFPAPISQSLMPLVGVMDIFVGVSIFFFPTRAILIWAAFWTVFTALLRPSAGMGMSEFFERAGNYGPPIAFLFMIGWSQFREKAFQRIQWRDLNWNDGFNSLEKILRWSLVALLIGHGGLSFFNENALITKHLEFLGFAVDSTALKVFGAFEMLLGVVVFFVPRLPGLMIFILSYKLFTEMLHPIVGQHRDMLETIERMGDYIIPIMLLVMYSTSRKSSFAL